MSNPATTDEEILQPEQMAILASKYGKTNILKYLIGEEKVSTKITTLKQDGTDDKQNALLYLAASEGHIETVKYLSSLQEIQKQPLVEITVLYPEMAQYIVTKDFNIENIASEDLACKFIRNYNIDLN